MAFPDMAMEAKAGVATGATYIASSGLMVGKYMDYISANATAIGGVCIIFTTLTNFIFRWFDRRDKARLIEARLEEINEE